jgi:hypothetical protein
VIRLCLSIWNRSPEAYKELKESGMVVLPSGRLLQMCKNLCCQNPGLNESVGNWMRQEAIKWNIGPEGKEGGVILDEVYWWEMEACGSCVIGRRIPKHANYHERLISKLYISILFVFNLQTTSIMKITRWTVNYRYWSSNGLSIP